MSSRSLTQAQLFEILCFCAQYSKLLVVNWASTKIDGVKVGVLFHKDMDLLLSHLSMWRPLTTQINTLQLWREPEYQSLQWFVINSWAICLIWFLLRLNLMRLLDISTSASIPESSNRQHSMLAQMHPERAIEGDWDFQRPPQDFPWHWFYPIWIASHSRNPKDLSFSSFFSVFTPSYASLCESTLRVFYNLCTASPAVAVPRRLASSDARWCFLFLSP